MTPQKLSEQPLALKSELLGYLSEIQDLENEVSEEQQDELLVQYRRLHALFKEVSREEIVSVFDKDLQNLVESLELGAEHQSQYQSLLEKFKSNNATSEAAVLAFIKTDEFYGIITGKAENLDAEEMRSVQEIFGSVLGFELSKEHVKMVKTEEFGRIVGYAISGLFEADLDAYNKDHAGASTSSPEFFEYLLKRIREQDVEFVCIGSTGKEDIFTKIQINENVGSNGKLRAKSRPNHCFVNHKNRTILVGGSTSNADLGAKGDTSYLSKKGLELLTTTKGSTYYGYETRSFFFSSGLLSEAQSPGLESGPGGDMGEAIRKALTVIDPINGKTLGLESPNAIEMGYAQKLSRLTLSPHYGLLANSRDFSTLVANCELKMFIAGANSERVLRLANSLEGKDEAQKRQIIFEHLKQGFLEGVEIFLNHPIDPDQQGQKGTSERILLDTIELAKIMRRATPLSLKATKEEFEIFWGPVKKQLNAVFQKCLAKYNSEVSGGYKANLMDLSERACDVVDRLTYDGFVRDIKMSVFFEEKKELIYKGVEPLGGGHGNEVALR